MTRQEATELARTLPFPNGAIVEFIEMHESKFVSEAALRLFLSDCGRVGLAPWFCVPWLEDHRGGS